MRGRNNNNNSSGNNNNNGNRKAPNPLQRSYESNGPDVKVRGTAQHVAEKYLQLARDAQSSGDPVAAENYFQHAEHYYRILLAAQEQMSQQFGHSFPPNRAFNDTEDDGEEDGDDDVQGFQPNGPQPDIRNGGMNGGGYNGAPRQDGDAGEARPQGGQRFDRPDRGNQDRTTGPDRAGQDRAGQDRAGQDRNGPERNGQERFNNDRPNNDRPNNDRNGNRRFDRNDRGERRFDRPEGGQPNPAGPVGQGGGQPNQGNQGGYQPRPDAPRSDIPVAAEQPDIAAVPVPREPRPERAPRPERRPRREPDADMDGDVAAALPSFLTTPVRVPVAVEEPAAPAVASDAPNEDGTQAADAAPKRPRGRRRSPREVMDALGSDGDNVTE